MSDTPSVSPPPGARPPVAAREGLKSKPCTVVLALTILMFAGLIATGRSGTLTLLDVGVLTIEGRRGAPSACIHALAQLSVAKSSLSSAAESLAKAQRDVLQFEAENAIPDKEGAWGRGRADGPTWGDNLRIDEQKWKSVTGQRKIVSTLMGDVATSLNDTAEHCNLQ